MRSDERQVTSGPESGAGRRTTAPTSARLMRVTLPEAVALLELTRPRALRRLLEAAGVRLRRSGLGEPVIRGADLRALTGRQPPSERPAYAALERAVLRPCRHDVLFFHHDLVAEIQRDCPDVERAERTERYAHALLLAVGFGFIEATLGLNAAFYAGPTTATTRQAVGRVRKLLALVKHPE